MGYHGINGRQCDLRSKTDEISQAFHGKSDNSRPRVSAEDASCTCSHRDAHACSSHVSLQCSKVKRQTACKPGSVPALQAGDDHSSGTPVAGRLARPTRTAARKRPPRRLGGPAIPTWSCSRWGLPCRRRCRRRGALLPHHFTLAAAGPKAAGSAVCFCGTFPRVAPAGRYPAPCFRGARTFLPRLATAKAAIRPSGAAR